ncbi:hypothetical protein WK34_14710 [Burkholderia vietnamiensis]|nr:hypothetical protein WK34_14710 [Burkholderia vietnamiensis]
MYSFGELRQFSLQRVELPLFFRAVLAEYVNGRQLGIVATRTFKDTAGDGRMIKHANLRQRI